MNNQTTIIVGMSGGVDSSVSALLLKQQGYRVIGLFMKNWEEEDDHGQCTSTDDYNDVRRVCEQLDIPYYAVNFVEDYRNQVFELFIEDFKRGLTPNPDILCNKEIKFKTFLRKAQELGADYLATGHYAQIGQINGLVDKKRGLLVNRKSCLLKGKDPQKDQSYFLYTLTHEILDKVKFPLGHLEKNEVRRLARQHGLATSEKKDSTGICFIGERHFRNFLSQYIGAQPGNFQTLDGKIVGKHMGVAYYTIGQRKGMGIGGPGDPWFVVEKDIEKGIVYVEQGANHPALYCDELIATDLSWVVDAPAFPLACQSKVRYRQADHSCTLQWIKEGRAKVTFPNPQRAVTPGQSVVFYDGEVCLGGGVISEVGPSYYHQGKLVL